MPDRPLRLLYVTARAPFGGGETFVLDEIAALLAQGHDVRLVPLRPRGGLVHGKAAALVPRTEAVALLAPAVLAAAWREFRRAPAQAVAVLASLLTWRPRALLANLIAYPKALWLAERLRQLGIEHVHAHWATTPAALALAAARMAGISWSLTAHRYDLLANDLLARKAGRAAFVRVTSRHGAALAIARGVAPERLLYLPMGTPIPTPILLPLTVPATLRVLVPARLEPVKGHDVLLDAAARLQDRVQFLCAGDGSLRQDLARRIAARGLANVRLLGLLPQEEMLALLRSGSIDAVVLASRHEGVPHALMEAMALRVPVVATAVGGTPELVGDGGGLLVPPNDAAALAAALERLRSDPALRRRLAAAGRDRVVRDFALPTVSARLAARFALAARPAVSCPSPRPAFAGPRTVPMRRSA